MYIDDFGNIFDWDEDKNQANIQKHEISFQEASSSFNDDFAVVLPDETHSKGEERFLLIGFSDKERMLFVSHCYRDSDEIVRIISARKATRAEHRKYHSNY